MKKAVIWDLDGTLLDSYHVIVESLRLVMREAGAEVAYNDIWQHTITYSVSSFIHTMAESYHLQESELKQRYAQISGDKYREILTMPNAYGILEALQSQNIQNFVYTHRGKTTIPVLDHLNMTAYFQEILTSQSGFARKPAPDAIEYLINKYNFDKSKTYYVGDRSLDMQCAANAGIAGILYLDNRAPGEATGVETYIVHDLTEIASIV